MAGCENTDNLQSSVHPLRPCCWKLPFHMFLFKSLIMVFQQCNCADFVLELCYVVVVIDIDMSLSSAGMWVRLTA
jgi:hypothetical protein